MRDDGLPDTPVQYCVGRTCHLTGLCIQVQDALQEHFKEKDIAPRPCMKLCRRGGAFSIYGDMFTSWDLENLDQIVQAFNVHETGEPV